MNFRQRVSPSPVPSAFLSAGPGASTDDEIALLKRVTLTVPTASS